jgi:hypothetical protein
MALTTPVQIQALTEVFPSEVVEALIMGAEMGAAALTASDARHPNPEARDDVERIGDAVAILRALQHARRFT